MRDLKRQLLVCLFEMPMLSLFYSTSKIIMSKPRSFRNLFSLSSIVASLKMCNPNVHISTNRSKPTSQSTPYIHHTCPPGKHWMNERSDYGCLNKPYPS